MMWTIEISNIPKNKFLEVKRGVLRALYDNGIKLEDIETIEIVDGVTDAFEGYEFEIRG